MWQFWIAKKIFRCLYLYGSTILKYCFLKQLDKVTYNENISIINAISSKAKTRLVNRNADHVVMRSLNWETSFLQEMSSSLMTAFAIIAIISNARLKLTKTQAQTRQHPETEPLLFENYSLSSSTLSSKNDRKYYKQTYKKANTSV